MSFLNISFLILFLYVSATKSNEIKPFHFQIDAPTVTRLQTQLRAYQWPDVPVPEENTWNAGVNISFVREMALKWLERDWSSPPAWLPNARKETRERHYVTEIDGVSLHFVHWKHENQVPRRKTETVTFLLCHGWPTSYLEFYALANSLHEAGFDVVVPSLPGYIFSRIYDMDRAQNGYTMQRIGGIFAALMRRLEVDRYIVQGGDWGGFIATEVAARDETHCVGLHLNMPVAASPVVGVFSALRVAADLLLPSFVSGLTQREWERIKSCVHYLTLESSYLQYQALKPNTIGLVMHDHPVALLTYIVEKYHAWSYIPPNSSLCDVLSCENIIDTVMLYYISESFASSVHMYREHLVTQDVFAYAPRAAQPTSILALRKELCVLPRHWLASFYTDIVRFRDEPSFGGHFAASELPQLMLAELLLLREHIDSAVVDAASSADPLNTDL